ncbi:MAG: EAL domain-containing protein [Culicoidibacterales bacterium]
MNGVYQKSDRYQFVRDLAKQSAYTLVCFDIIDFARINYQYGVETGDQVLKQIFAQVVTSSQGAICQLCRYENDLILAVMETQKVAEITTLIESVALAQYEPTIQLRVGYQFIADALMLEQCLAAVAYVMKQPNYQFQNTLSSRHNLQADIAMVNLIKHSLLTKNSADFQLVYQPKIRTADQRVVSCEVLSRWSNHSGQIRMPDEFLPIVRLLEKEFEFDILIFAKACAQMQKFRELCPDFSVNICTQTLQHQDFVETMLALVAQYELQPQQITLEIVEDVGAINHQIVMDVIKQLSTAGFKISIDDFGTGYSSYARLAMLHFDEVKIPREFLLLYNNVSMKKSKQILHGVVQFCRALECQIVIEGVETQADVALTQELGIEMMQGYYFAKPLTRTEFVAYLQTKLQN